MVAARPATMSLQSRDNEIPRRVGSPLRALPLSRDLGLWDPVPGLVLPGHEVPMAIRFLFPLPIVVYRSNFSVFRLMPPVHSQHQKSGRTRKDGDAAQSSSSILQLRARPPNSFLRTTRET